MDCPPASRQPVCPSHPLSFHRRSDRLRPRPSQNARRGSEIPALVLRCICRESTSARPLCFCRENIIDARLGIREKAWSQSGYRSCPFQSARPVGEVGRVEGKVGRAHCVESAGIAFSQLGEKPQQDRLVALRRYSILFVHVLYSLKVPANVVCDRNLYASNPFFGLPPRIGLTPATIPWTNRGVRC